MMGSTSFSAIPIFEFVDLLILAGRSGIGGEGRTFGTDLEEEVIREHVAYSSLNCFINYKRLFLFFLFSIYF